MQYDFDIKVWFNEDERHTWMRVTEKANGQVFAEGTIEDVTGKFMGLLMVIAR